ncbi:hypothetical protein JCM18918_1831 [Cutibacterium acnes JCM 18918]|nr:hypothetical protein JCM18918_1831 [Cutibacterium acnes JCM 18918]
MWFLPAVDVLVGALVALAVGAGGLLLAALQDHLDTLGPGDVIVVIVLAVALSFRRVMPITSAAVMTLVWINGTYATPYMATNWVSTLAFFSSPTTPSWCGYGHVESRGDRCWRSSSSSWAGSS